MTLAATLTTRLVSNTISNADPGVFMHGPTFMGNPLACAVALASIQMLLDSDWVTNIDRIQHRLTSGLEQAKDLPTVKDVRTLGAIGVIEMQQPFDTALISNSFLKLGVWLRPFNRLIYTMPSYITSDSDLDRITDAMFATAKAV